MTGRSLFGHVRRYPGWYGAALVWLVAMVALPVVQLDPLEVFQRGQDAAAPAAGGTTVPTAPGAAGGPDRRAGAPNAAPPSTDGGTAEETTDGGPAVTTTAPTPIELVPPEILDLVFDALPPLVLPALPEELATLAAAIAPIAATGCSGLGLASVVVAVVAQSAEGVPIERLLPYLSPVSTACAAFPIPPQHTVCAADAPFVIDLGGLTSTPPILGLGIDQLDALETVMADTFGVSVPRLAPELRRQLDCTLVT